MMRLQYAFARNIANIVKNVSRKNRVIITFSIKRPIESFSLKKRCCSRKKTDHFSICNRNQIQSDIFLITVDSLNLYPINLKYVLI